MPKYLIVAVVLFCAFFAKGQYRPDSTQFRLETRDGNVYYGYMVSQEFDEVVFQTKNIGTIRIQKSDIKSIQAVDSSSKSSSTTQVRSFHTSHYFNTPSGYGMKKGEINYKNTYLFVNHLNYGFSDRFSLGIGTVPLFLFAGTNSPFWLTPKLSFPLVENRVNLSFSGFLAGITGYSEIVSLGSGVVTLGDRNKNISGGLTYGLYDGQVTELPLFTLSGMLRSADNHFFMGEGFISTDFRVAIVGGRWIWKNASIDYGLMVISDRFDYFGVPYGSMIIPIR